MQKKMLPLLLVLLLAPALMAQAYYLGMGDANSTGISACAACHKAGMGAPATYDTYKLTRHAVAYDSLKATPGFGFNCLGCHNTGWDATKTNYGADEYVRKDTTVTPNYVITDAANFAKVKNIGCETCHQPMGNASRMLDFSLHSNPTYNKPNYGAELCGQCHQGSHHPYYEEWRSSVHSRSTEFAYVNSNKSCTKCHVAQNFIAWVKQGANYRDTVYSTDTTVIKPLTCQGCHDSHSNANPGQLRMPITGTSTICDKCHTVGTTTVNVSSTPHHTTAEVLSGTPNFGYQYPGETYQNSIHTLAATNRCVNCHVFATAGNPAGTGHGFEPKVQACKSCHADYYTAVDTSNHATRFNYRRTQTVTDSLIAFLSAKLARATSADSATNAFKQARYNLLSIQAEGSRGIHNTKLVQKLLRDAIAKFTPTAVEQEAGIPQSFALSQNFPNPFNPATSIKFSVPAASMVTIRVYDAIGNEVATLVNEEMKAGNYRVDWNGASFSSGIYYYKLEAGSTRLVKKMILVK